MPQQRFYGTTNQSPDEDGRDYFLRAATQAGPASVRRPGPDRPSRPCRPRGTDGAVLLRLAPTSIHLNPRSSTVHLVSSLTRRRDDRIPFPRPRLSKTAGYRHASIPAAIAAPIRLASASAPTDAPFTVHHSEDASLFAPESLRRYRVIVLAHVSGTFLTSSQLAALQSFVREGGGVVGVHTASVGMPPPPPPPPPPPTDADGAVDEGRWYRRMVGASFAGHPES